MGRAPERRSGRGASRSSATRGSCARTPRSPRSAPSACSKFKDYGNPTKGEIDRLFKILTRYKKQGQFRAFWSAFTDSVNFMVSGRS